MRTIHRDVSAVSRTLGIRRADLAGARSAQGRIRLYLTSGGLPVAPLVLPAEQFISGHADDCIAVRDYGDHRGLHRVLEAAGIAQPVSRDSAGGAPVVIMRVAACLLAKMPTARPQQKASA